MHGPRVWLHRGEGAGGCLSDEGGCPPGTSGSRGHSF